MPDLPEKSVRVTRLCPGVALRLQCGAGRVKKRNPARWTGLCLAALQDSLATQWSQGLKLSKPRKDTPT